MLSLALAVRYSYVVSFFGQERLGSQTNRKREVKKGKRREKGGKYIKEPIKELFHFVIIPKRHLKY